MLGTPYAELHGPGAEAFVLILPEWHGAGSVLTEFNQLTKPQDLLLAGKKKRRETIGFCNVI